MITKMIGSFFLGLLFVLLLDFLVFAGIKINYIDFYGIKEYYNLLFVDNQPYILIVAVALLFSYLISDRKIFKVFGYFYLALMLLSLSTLYGPVGKVIGELIFRKESQDFRFGKIAFSGDMLYKGRRYTYIYRKDLNKVIRLSNSKLSYGK